ncbi:Rdx family protein [Haladaptatus sp. ZSTT2]|uniref:Rdx family protein n=1 Tax=Haladaptatus sp. ZSTT2 TaxID=3120515 RepID=UPI00300F461B
MTDVEIAYCVPCGYLPRAEELQHAILTSFEGHLDSLTLRMGDHGVLRVTVDDEIVYDKADDEYDVDAIVRACRTHIF